MYSIGGVSFLKRKKVTITNNSGGALTDFETNITVTYAAAMQTAFGDIRFAYPNGTNIPYWIESKTDSSTASVWIKVSLPKYGTSPTGDNVIYMYYGNAAISSASSSTNTFVIWDDFSGGLGQWTQSAGTGTISNPSSTLQIVAPRNVHCNLYKLISTDNILAQFKVKTTDLTAASWASKIAIYWAWGDWVSGDLGHTTSWMADYTIAGTNTLNYAITGAAINTDYWLRVYMTASTVYLDYSTNGTSWTAITNFARPSSFSGAPAAIVIGKGAGETGYTNTYLANDYGTPGASVTDTIDNVIVRQYRATVPTATFGNEEHSRKGGIVIY